MNNKKRLSELLKAKTIGMAKIATYQYNIQSCYRMIEQNNKMITAISEILKKNNTELLTLQADHDYENDVACEEYLETINKIK